MADFQKSSLRTTHCLSYSVPVIAAYWLVSPIGVIQGVYAKYFGLPLATIAAVILFARIFDAVSDLAVGYYVDRYYRRHGTRKPFILAGGLLFSISSYFLCVPSDLQLLRYFGFSGQESSSQVSAAYFCFWFIAFYLSWTLFEISHIAWGGGLARSSQDKTKLYAFRSFTHYIGLALFYSIPLLPLFETRNITPEALRFSAIAAGMLMIFLLAYSLKKTPNVTNSEFIKKTSICHKKHSDNISHAIKTNYKNSYKRKWKKFICRFMGAIQSIFYNKPFLLLIGGFLLSNIASGLWFSLIFIYVDSYLGLGDKFSEMFLVAIIVGALVTPFFFKLAKTFGKKFVWVIAASLIIISFIYTYTLSAGKAGFFDLVMLKTIQTLGFACSGMVAPALLSEAIDYGSLKYGTDNTAMYFSIYTFISKTGGAIAAALGLGIVGWYGIDMTLSTQSESAVWALKLAITGMPVGFTCLALVVIGLYPINARRHSVIQRRLDIRVARNSEEKI